MIPNVLTKIFGSRNERLLKQYSRTVSRINALEPEIAALSDEQLRAKTGEFKGRVSEAVSRVDEDRRTQALADALEDLLPEAFAVINPKQQGDPYPDKDLAGVGEFCIRCHTPGYGSGSSGSCSAARRPGG